MDNNAGALQFYNLWMEVIVSAEKVELAPFGDLLLLRSNGETSKKRPFINENDPLMAHQSTHLP